jgi:hypothetical protein
MQNMVSADMLVLLLSQKVILVCLSSRGMIYVTGDWWSKPSMKCEMVEEMAVVNRLIDLHVVLIHILPEASSFASTSASIEVKLKHRN